jgi:plasmid stabilization system protein ParE
MAYDLIITKAAQSQIDDILSYISQKLDNPSAAKDFLNAIEDCYSYLTFNPFIYPECDNDGLKSQKLRKAIIKNYVMLFKVDKSKKIVYIMYFFFGRQDYMKLI